MSPKHEPLRGIPTHVITGFLGSGKSTAILHLLGQRPPDERWAVLVNEFGEIGVDGSVLAGQHTPRDGVFVAEVPGGCMCCTAGLPMQIALAQLLRRARPSRLLIEPTGLGHPYEVLQTLVADHYRDVLAVEKTVTLIDARNLSDPRYTSHPTFLQQIQTADVIVGNKEDLYTPRDRVALDDFVRAHAPATVTLCTTRRGAMSLDLLRGPSALQIQPRTPSGNASYPAKSAPSTLDAPLPEEGMLRAMNSGEGFQSMGWRFSPSLVFDRDRVIGFLKSLGVERVKGVFITRAGIFAYNGTRDGITEVDIDECTESRIEIIAESVDDGWEQQLKHCLADTSRGD